MSFGKFSLNLLKKMFSKSSEYNVLAEGMYFLDKSSPSNFNFLEFPLLVWSCPNSSSRLFKSFEFRNGSRMSDKKLVILEFKYLQNKKWKKQAVKRTRRKKSYKTYWTIYLDNWEKLAIFLQKLSIFNIYYVFAPFVKLRECRFFYFFSLYDIRNEPIFLILEHSSLSGVNQKKSWKKH